MQGGPAGDRRPWSSPDAPDYLIPRMGELPVRNAVHFMSAHLTSGQGSGEPTVVSKALTIKAAPAAQLPATGVLLTHEQGWYAQGIALGRLLHSVALAPGEVTQVAVIDWMRNESGSADESTAQDDDVTTSDKQDRSVNEVQDSTTNEVQRGFSVGTSSGKSTESGTIESLLFGGSGDNSTTATSTNYTDGVKNVALASNQNVTAATLRHARASRARKAAVVREVHQGEGEHLTTRVVANYNHAHALSMLYFEVVEVHAMSTKVVDAERLIYLPMEVVDFDVESLARFGEVLAAAAQRRGDTELSNQITAWLKAERRPVALQIKNAKQVQFYFDSRHNDGSHMQYFHATAPPGYFALGDYAVTSGQPERPGDLKYVQAVEVDALKAPVAFIKAADYENACLWEPVPPAGYVTLGTLVRSEEPPLSSVVCVREDLVGPAVEGPSIAVEHGAKGTVSGQAVTIVPMVAADGGISSGSFLVKERRVNPLALDASRVHSEDHDAHDILNRLNHQKLFYNQVIWMSREPGALLESLRDLKWPSDATRALSASVDPNPVTLSGNYVGYRWHFEHEEEQRAFVAEHTAEESTVYESVAMPTGGVFAEGVLGQSISAEKIDLTRFWKWQDSPIPILPTSIDPLSATSRARDLDTSTGKLAQNAAVLDQLQALPDPSGFGAITDIMKSQVFRDMSGADVVKELALDASKHAAEGSKDAAALASKNLGSFMGFMKDMTAAATQLGGMDSTTMGGLQNQNNEGGADEGGGEETPEGDGDDTGDVDDTNGSPGAEGDSGGDDESQPGDQGDGGGPDEPDKPDKPDKPDSGGLSDELESVAEEAPEEVEANPEVLLA